MAASRKNANTDTYTNSFATLNHLADLFTTLSLIGFIVILWLIHFSLTISILRQEQRNSQLKPGKPVRQRMVIKFIDKATRKEATELSVTYSSTNLDLRELQKSAMQAPTQTEPNVG